MRSTKRSPDVKSDPVHPRYQVTPYLRQPRLRIYMTKKVEKVVGIDLGTTFSVVAHLDADGKPVTVPNDEGELSTPSVVFFDANGVVVGNEAVNAAEYEAERVANFAKRDIGSDRFHKKILGHSLPPEVIQAIILHKLKDDAELKIGEFFKAVITVPAYFNEPRRKATQDAGKMAGLDVLDIINEPTAAAIAFGVKAGFVTSDGVSKKSERVLVYDLGGGTFDVTLMELKGHRFNTVATAGDVHLGGIDWDLRILDHFADQFELENGIDPRTDKTAFQKLRQLATRAKKTLTARDEAQVRFAFDSKRSSLSINRDEFNSLTEDLVERTKLTVNRLLRDAGAKWKDVSRLLLVGGSTRMPMIQSMLIKESGLDLDRSLSPDEAVAHGAAVYADMLHRKGDGVARLDISNVNSHDLGVMGVDPKTKKAARKLMIRRNTKLPTIKTSKFITSKESQKEVIVTVVEGGTETGQGATRIGKCRISGLPEGLSKGSVINVTFKYGTDGRLTVNAEMPSADVRARTTIDRASGMITEDIASWKSRIRQGIKLKHRKEESVDPEKAKSIPQPVAAKKTKPKPPPIEKQDKPEFPALGEKKKSKAQSFKGIDLGEEVAEKKEADSFVLDDVDDQKRVDEDSGFDSFLGKLE